LLALWAGEVDSCLSLEVADISESLFFLLCGTGGAGRDGLIRGKDLLGPLPDPDAVGVVTIVVPEVEVDLGLFPVDIFFFLWREFFLNSSIALCNANIQPCSSYLNVNKLSTQPVVLKNICFACQILSTHKSYVNTQWKNNYLLL
jgi:hypothetical protein